MNRTLLDGISIASPCSADWNQMQGDDRRRFCGSCKLHVHNLSGMTADAATALLQQAGQGRVCVRFFRRADGTVLLRDCPVGLRQRMRRALARAGAPWLALWGSTTSCTHATGSEGQTPPVPLEWKGEAVMGDMVAPPVAPQPEPGECMGRVAPPQEPPKK